MKENPFRRNPKNGAIGVLTSRSTLYKTGPHYKAATRNPAWIQVTGVGNGCFGKLTKKLPEDTSEFDTTYNPKGRFKLKPILKEVIIEYGGDFGLSQTINVTIECYTRSDFEDVEKAFLLPGNIITAKFGYGKSWNSGDQVSVSAGPFRVVTFNFTTTTEGYWVASCKGVAASEALKDIEISSIIKDTNLRYKAGNKTFPVIGMAELIAYDAQKNGQVSIDELDDGETITPAGKGAIVVYHADHLFSTKLASWWSKGVNAFDGKTEAEKTHNVVYVTLEYVIERLIMGQIKAELAKGVISDDKAAFEKLKIALDPEISYSWTSAGLRSGSPTTCLIMGDDKGNYQSKTDSTGKNFEKDCKDLSKVKAVVEKSGSRQKILHKNILIERSVIVKAFTEGAKNRLASADNADVKDTKDLVLPLEDFFKRIFDHISTVTGGTMQLRLIVDPDDTNRLVVADQNNGKAKSELQVVVFNPIDGDGSTRSCTIQSNVGGEEYKAYMFSTTSRKGDGATAVRGCKEKADSTRKSSIYVDAQKAIIALLYNPGTLGANQFGAIQENALIQAIGTLCKGAPESKKYELVPYMGMSIEIELDGVYGFIPGNAISTTQLSPRYLKEKMFFQVKQVTHIFNGEDSSWATKLSGFMTFYDSISPVRL